MRRSSPAMTLVVLAAASACSISPRPDLTAGKQRGVAGEYYYVNLFTPPLGGIVSSDLGAITCGASAVSVSAGVYSYSYYPGADACGTGGQTKLAWSQSVVLTAEPAAGNAFIGWGGDCHGTAPTCSLSAGADKTVIAIFGAPGSGHPNFLEGSVHSQAYVAYATGAAGALDCTTCHGASLGGQGIAPGCGLCHFNPGPKGTSTPPAAGKTGLVATFVSMTPANQPLQTVLKFSLKDAAGKNVDVTGAGFPGGSGQNMPMEVSLAFAYFYGSGDGYMQGYHSLVGADPAPFTAAYPIIANPIVSGTLPAADTFTFAVGTLSQGQADGSTRTCSVALPCTCTASDPCRYSGTAGFQAGRACTVASPCTCTAATPCGPRLPATDGPGNLTFDASRGVYTYTYASSPEAAFNSVVLSYNHTLFIAASRQENLVRATDATTFTAVNLRRDFMPLTGAASAVRREIVTDAACNRCHDGFRASTDTSTVVHGGKYVSAAICAVCHYEGSGPDAFGVFVHRIHDSGKLARVTSGSMSSGYQGGSACTVAAPCSCTTASPCLPSSFRGIAATGYPQDPRRCAACHDPAGQDASQNVVRANAEACTSCHDDIYFTGSAPAWGRLHTNYLNGAWPCAGCHTQSARNHQAFVPIDPNATLLGGTNDRTNAGCIPASGAWPLTTGAFTMPRITYAVQRVGLNASRNPTITFKLLRDGADVNFGAYSAATNPELITGTSPADPEFVGAPSLYFAWAVPQDGIAAPSDFNATANAWLKGIWTGAVAGATLTGPDPANANFYTATLGAVTVPAGASLLQGGVGYGYALSSAMPLTFRGPSWNSTVSGTGVMADCWATHPLTGATVGGAVEPTPNVWAVGDGFTARRSIVDTGKCNACHGLLGTTPVFHVGQRNDAPTCSWCHNPNRGSSAWSANGSTFIHAIHGAARRSVGYTWQASCSAGSSWNAASSRCENAGVATEPSTWYPEVEYPGLLRDCQACHLPGSYDFSAAASEAQLPSALWTTVGAGTYTAGPSTSPYVQVGQDYGAGFSYSASTGVATPAEATTLVSSPIAAACFSCHDAGTARAHMEAAGGRLYQPRGTGFDASAGVNQETCLSCHGAGRIWAIDLVH